MKTYNIGIIMNGVTGRMGTNQHLLRSILEIRKQGGVKTASNDIIIRLFEPTGRKRTTILSLPCIAKKTKIQFTPFEIKTLKINLKTTKITETSLLD